MTEIEIILSCLDDNTLNKIKRKCEAYQNYLVDYKQVNKLYDTKTRGKVFASLLELVNTQLVLNSFESSTNKSSENLKSTFEVESQPLKENKTKEKKK